MLVRSLYDGVWVIRVLDLVRREKRGAVAVQLRRRLFRDRGWQATGRLIRVGRGSLCRNSACVARKAGWTGLWSHGGRSRRCPRESRAR